MARILVSRPGYFCSSSAASASSFDCVRETRTTLKPFAASCEANSLPMPSEAPVTTAQVPFLPYLRSCRETRLGKPSKMWTDSTHIVAAQDEHVQHKLEDGA